MMKFKILIISIAIASISYYFFSKGVITQTQSYHQFADTRSFLGIPNTHDVLTNILFLIVGYLGVNEVVNNHKGLTTRKSWFWFFLSIFLIGPGSAYYHWAPDDLTLIWDRLPMSMGFMAMYVALVSEHIDLRVQKTLYLSLLLGISSVLVWVITSDLRLYYIVQFSSFVTVPIVLLVFNSSFSHKSYYFIALLFYALAKWTEVEDYTIFNATNELISGHSLKHILAAVGLYALWLMIKRRKAATRI